VADTVIDPALRAELLRDEIDRLRAELAEAQEETDQHCSAALTRLMRLLEKDAEIDRLRAELAAERDLHRQTLEALHSEGLCALWELEAEEQ
jgi:uncharacterized small protein (DUF1192 family)